jgi:arginyl-tRNA synthetase
MDDNKEIYIMNALDKEVTTQAFGNHFSFKPGQIKRMRQSLGDFLSREKGYMGLVEVSERLYDDKEYRDSEEGQREISAKREEGINKRVSHLQKVIHNLQVSLRQDLDQADIKADTYAFASDGEIQAMEELHKYQVRHEDANKARIEKARNLERKLKSSSNAPIASKKGE